MGAGAAVDAHRACHLTRNCRLSEQDECRQRRASCWSACPQGSDCSNGKDSGSNAHGREANHRGEAPIWLIELGGISSPVKTPDSEGYGRQVSFAQ